MREFVKIEDLRRNFEESIIEVGSKIYYCEVMRNLCLQLTQVEKDGNFSSGNGPTIILNLNGKDKNTIIRTPKLGWILSDRVPAFVSRACARQFLFGLNVKNTYIQYLTTSRIISNCSSFEGVYRKDFLSQIQAPPEEYNPTKDLQRLNWRFLSYNGTLWRETEKIGELDETGVFELSQEHPDTLTEMDLRELKIPFRYKNET